jgi:small subunit ribosomal protein S13
VAEEESDFKYVVRIANADLDGNKSTVLALTRLKGVGRRVAEIIINFTGVPRHEKIGNLSDEKIEEIKEFIDNLDQNVPNWLLNRQRDYDTNEDLHLFDTDLDMIRRDDINRLKMIRCYRGIRHERGQKVRGQRTKSTGRTGLTVGVVRKKMLAGMKKTKDKAKGK